MWLITNENGYEVFATTRKARQGVPFKQIEIDFTEPSTFNNTKLNTSFDFVFHAAGITPTSNGSNFFPTNLQGPLAFFSKQKFNRECKFIYISITPVYGTPPIKNISEFSKTAPNNDYAISKLKFEQQIRKIIMENGSDGHLLILRTPTLFGEKISSNLVSRLINLAKIGKSLMISNPGSKLNALIGENEIIMRALCEISNLSHLKVIQNCHTNGDITIYEFAEIIWKKFNAKPIRIIHKDNLTPPLFFFNKSSTWFEQISTRKIFLKYISN